MSELNKAVADLVIKATQAAEAAGKFAVEQLPDVAHQYVLYQAIVSCFYTVLFLAVLVTLAYGWKPVIRYNNTLGWVDKGPPLVGYGFFCFFAGIFAFAGFATYLERAILALFAPKILLIQWAAELVK